MQNHEIDRVINDIYENVKVIRSDQRSIREILIRHETEIAKIKTSFKYLIYISSGVLFTFLGFLLTLHLRF